MQQPVVGIVRITVKSLLVTCVLATPAFADEIRAVPDQAFTIGVIGTGGKIGSAPSGGWGVDVELALGRERTQFFLEGSLIEEKIGPEGDRLSGRGARAVGGVRWLARAFELGNKGSIDLHFEAFGGYSRLSIEHSRAIQRPELGLGVGYQLRGFTGGDWPRPQIAFRMSARIFFAPTDRADMETACRGTCTGSSSEAGSGLMVVFGAQL